MAVLQRRPSNPVDRLERSRYRRLLSLSCGLTVAEIENRGDVDAPDLRLRLQGPRSPAARAEATRSVRRLLGLDADPGALERLRRAAPVLAPTIDAVRGLRPPRFATLFETFLGVLPFQQLSIDSGLATLTRLVKRFGPSADYHGERLLGFPAAETLAKARIAELRACGFSTRKAEALRAVARLAARGALAEAELEALGSAQALQRLQKLPGVGPWSAGLMLLRGLGRTDVFPPGDVAAIPGVTTLLELTHVSELDRMLGTLGDLRGYLYYCALAASLLRRGLIQPASRAGGRADR